MQKTLEQIQQENRKFILEAIHGCSYEEAIKKELGVGCKVKIKRFFSIKDFNEEIFIIDNYCDFSIENLFRTIGSSYHNEITEIIGKPLTLSRVLLAFKNKEVRTQFGYRLYFGIESSKICSLRMHSRTAEKFMEGEFDWDLKKETLEEQTEETQRGINKILTRE